MRNSFKHLMCYYFYNYNLKSKPKDETFLDYLTNILYILRNKKSFLKIKLVQLIENFLKNKEVKEIIEDIRTSIKKVANICEQYNNLSLGSINADNFTEDKIYQILEKLKNSVNMITIVMIMKIVQNMMSFQKKGNHCFCK